MPSQGVTNVANAIINKINNLISSHNSNENAHQDIRNSIPKIFYAACDCSEQNRFIELECEDWNTEQGNIIYVRFNNVDNHYSTYVMDLSINEEPIPVHNTIDFYNNITPLTLFRDAVVKFTCYFIDENTPIFLYEFSTLTSELYNDIGFITSSSVPSASSATPLSDTQNGGVGTGTAWARSDHTHPKSSLYAESIHGHGIEETDLFNVLDCINNNFDNFSDNILYAPLLNGTETVYTIPYDANGTSINFQPTISDNQLQDGAGYLSDGWDNTVDWELTFEYYTTGDNNGYTVIPLGTDKRDYNGIQQWYNRQLNFYINGNKPSDYLSNAGLSLNTWISVKITKEDYVWKVYYDDVLKTTFDLSSYSSIVDDWTTMCIGVDRNMSKYSARIRSIMVKEI